jgi:hypothetical protein
MVKVGLAHPPVGKTELPATNELHLCEESELIEPPRHPLPSFLGVRQVDAVERD